MASNQRCCWRRVPEECPAEVRDLIQHCLSLEPSQRPTAMQVYDRLHNSQKAPLADQVTLFPSHDPHAVLGVTLQSLWSPRSMCELAVRLCFARSEVLHHRAAAGKRGLVQMQGLLQGRGCHTASACQPLTVPRRAACTACIGNMMQGGTRRACIGCAICELEGLRSEGP